MLGVQGTGTELLDSVHVNHLGQIVIVPDLDLLDLVRGPEAVEEVDKGHPALDGGQVGHSAQIHDLLHAALGQHGKAGLAAGHHVGVITEDVQALGGHGTGGDVEHARQQLTGDLVHIGDHEEQALGCGVGGGQGTGGQGAVDGTGSTGLGLHLDDPDRVAEDVLPTGSGPLVNIVGHGAGRGDGVDTRHLGKRIGNMRCRGVTVHGFELSRHFERFLLTFCWIGFQLQKTDSRSVHFIT